MFHEDDNLNQDFYIGTSVVLAAIFLNPAIEYFSETSLHDEGEGESTSEEKRGKHCACQWLGCGGRPVRSKISDDSAKSVMKRWDGDVEQNEHLLEAEMGTMLEEAMY